LTRRVEPDGCTRRAEEARLTCSVIEVRINEDIRELGFSFTRTRHALNVGSQCAFVEDGFASRGSLLRVEGVLDKVGETLAKGSSRQLGSVS
jgi:hypothetical protein